MALRLIRTLLGVPGFLATVPPGSWPGVDTSVGVSGPYDFVVRIRITRQLMPIRPSHPAPNTRDDREAPLSAGAGCTNTIIHFRKTEEKYFRTRLLKYSI